MTEIFEPGHLHLIARLPAVEIIDNIGAAFETDEVQIEFFADGIDVAEQILVLLFGRDRCSPAYRPAR